MDSDHGITEINACYDRNYSENQNPLPHTHHTTPFTLYPLPTHQQPHQQPYQQPYQQPHNNHRTSVAHHLHCPHPNQIIISTNLHLASFGIMLKFLLMFTFAATSINARISLQEQEESNQNWRKLLSAPRPLLSPVSPPSRRPLFPLSEHTFEFDELSAPRQQLLMGERGDLAPPRRAPAAPPGDFEFAQKISGKDALSKPIRVQSEIVMPPVVAFDIPRPTRLRVLGTTPNSVLRLYTAADKINDAVVREEMRKKIQNPNEPLEDLELQIVIITSEQ